MKRRKFASLIAALCLAGCAAGPPPNAKKVRFVAEGQPGPKISGLLRAASPGTAGMATKSVEFDVPGSIEFMGGPSEYSLTLSGPSDKVKFQIFVDGKELKRGPDIVWEDDKGPRLTFEVR